MLLLRQHKVWLVCLCWGISVITSVMVRLYHVWRCALFIFCFNLFRPDWGSQTPQPYRGNIFIHLYLCQSCGYFLKDDFIQPPGQLVKIDFNRASKRGISWKSSANRNIVLMYIQFLRTSHKSNVWHSERRIKIVNFLGFQVEEEEWETTTIDHRCEVTGTRPNLRKNRGKKCYVLHPLAPHSLVLSFVCSFNS